MMTTPKKIQILLTLSGLTQDKLAQKLGVSFVTLNNWLNANVVPRESAQIRIDELYKEYSGEKIISTTELSAKKNILLNKQKSHPSLLKHILNRVDLRDEFILSLTYNSNSIEGSTLTEDETASVLFDNKQLPNKSLIEVLEAKNHQTAFQFVLSYCSENKKISEKFILRLHEILMNSIRDDAGMYRTHGVRIVGANIPTANYMKVPELMRNLIQEINETQKDTVAHISKIHSIFEKIHPFSDGNGRVGRLLMHTMLLQKNFPPAMIYQESKQLYYSYLNKAQRSEDYSLLENFLCDAVLAGFGVME